MVMIGGGDLAANPAGGRDDWRKTPYDERYEQNNGG